MPKPFTIPPGTLLPLDLDQDLPSDAEEDLKALFGERVLGDAGRKKRQDEARKAKDKSKRKTTGSGMFDTIFLDEHVPNPPPPPSPANDATQRATPPPPPSSPPPANDTTQPRPSDHRQNAPPPATDATQQAIRPPATDTTPQAAPAIAIGVPQESFAAYKDAWEKIGSNKCSPADLPLPLCTTNVQILRTQLRNEVKALHAATSRWEVLRREHLEMINTKTRDEKYTGYNIFKLRTEMFLADGVFADWKVEEEGGHAVVKLYWDAARTKDLDASDTEEDLRLHNGKLAALQEHFKKEKFRGHQDQLDRRTNCTHLDVERRTSQNMMVKAIYNGIMNLKEQTEKAIKRGGKNPQQEDIDAEKWVPDRDPEE
ncbi:hypothetical protein CLAFUW4_11612 [Fulvia fulva]|uniref:Uncharacterized protein n=1 Tax=Passalora fulva TaxID=5499 RepID=A0A9Q8PBX0_PASFU|nr:uncharacterized protein CLAFUR5_10657 [Fulvia fulva]KAK4619316.1 hypothetical protein CLAFUR4_11617 [Fulvia fulva]KAK4620534.1 hypothetical protein CLAFUR0_11626 [Fulvia fulva]UJO19642.1 hypothetical protein CLAFUR5_10657 [Fulvia fulva]WPV17587.1 hypothetical protein CLAFUW4_11612 [Fulvia fulva]WPV32127.1 hypothetical protein CLAFUW7_11616 [Fulvia fulva]